MRILSSYTVVQFCNLCNFNAFLPVTLSQINFQSGAPDERSASRFSIDVDLLIGSGIPLYIVPLYITSRFVL